MEQPPYALDELGWLQFDRLCRLVLTDTLGQGAPVWIGRPGRGQVALLDGSVEIPGSRRSLPGPVSVLCTWAPPRPSAWRRASEFVARATASTDAIDLGRSTLLLTNLPRDSARDALRVAGIVEDRQIAVLGCGELSRLLDRRATLRWAMPSVLGLRDLRPLIPEALLQSSAFDPKDAAALARVFWPTAAYDRARAVLARHRFVVLTGPPEMGKTAIARMLALALMTDGWQAHECIRPDEVWAAHDPASRQVFVADDAFGSTEYLPDAGECWAQAMSELLPRLDDRHWLIWTSRPAPLKAGLRRLQRERGAERFPAPGEVTVDAGDLTLAEKTLILFRHAKASDVLNTVRSPIQQAGVEIVEHPHFTPERIRRLVAVLPERAPLMSEHPEAVQRMLDWLIATPTEAMRSSYRALGAEHRELLVALLDAPAGLIDERKLAATIRRHHPGGLSRQPSELIDRLTDHFLRVTSLGIGWVHPSWRDLVIDELRSDPAARRRFLHTCGVDGAVLALSGDGGVAGERSLPLLLIDADWDALGDRCAELIRELEDAQLLRLLLSARAALEPMIDANVVRAELAHLATAMLTAVARRVESGCRLITSGLVEAWYELRAELAFEGQLPLARTWIELRPGPTTDVLLATELTLVDEWLAIAQVLQRHDRPQLESLNFDSDRALLTGIAWKLARARVVEDSEPLRSVVARISELHPDIAAGAGAVIRAHELRRVRVDRRWWTPSDIAAPPSLQPVSEAGGFERADVRRVLDDL